MKLIIINHVVVIQVFSVVVVASISAIAQSFVCPWPATPEAVGVYAGPWASGFKLALLRNSSRSAGVF